MRLTVTMLDLLARASVVADGPVQRMDPNKGHGHTKRGGMEPRGSTKSLGDLMVERWNTARNEGERRRAEQWCERLLDHATHTQPPPAELVELELMRGTIHFKRMVANSDEKVAKLATRHMVSRKQIYVWRERYRDDGEAA